MMFGYGVNDVNDDVYCGVNNDFNDDVYYDADDDVNCGKMRLI